MNDLMNKYLGKNAEDVKQALINAGYEVIIERIEPKKDKDILSDELVIQIKKQENRILLITSMFKKYIWFFIYIFWHFTAIRLEWFVFNMIKYTYL